MKAGDILKIAVKQVPDGVDKEGLTQAFSEFGAVTSLSVKGDYAELSLKWNGKDFLDSSGLGEVTAPNGKLIGYGLVAPRRDA